MHKCTDINYLFPISITFYKLVLAQHTFHDENIISAMATTVTMSHIFPHYDFSLEATGHEKI